MAAPSSAGAQIVAVVLGGTVTIQERLLGVVSQARTFQDRSWRDRKRGPP